MIKCEIWTYSDAIFIQREVERCYRKYEVLDIKFSTAVYSGNLLKYSVMITYKERQENGKSNNF